MGIFLISLPWPTDTIALSWHENIRINVQLKYYLCKLDFSKNHNKIVDHNLPFADPPPPQSVPPVHYLKTFFKPFP